MNKSINLFVKMLWISKYKKKTNGGENTISTFASPNIERPVRRICRNELWSGQSLCRVIPYYLELNLQENTNILNNNRNQTKSTAASIDMLSLTFSRRLYDAFKTS